MRLPNALVACRVDAAGEWWVDVIGGDPVRVPEGWPREFVPGSGPAVRVRAVVGTAAATLTLPDGSGAWVRAGSVLPVAPGGRAA